MRRLSIVIYVGMALALAAAGAACGGGGSGGSSTKTAGQSQTEIGVRLTEYSVTPAIASVSAGSVKFDAQAIGGTAHELVVIQTSLAPDALPTKSDGSVDEAGPGITVVGKTASIDPSTTKSLSVNLSTGSYVLICNLVQVVNGQTVSHYQKKMYAAFTVK